MRTALLLAMAVGFCAGLSARAEEKPKLPPGVIAYLGPADNTLERESDDIKNFIARSFSPSYAQ
jgi:hypothetical protein